MAAPAYPGLTGKSARSLFFRRFSLIKGVQRQEIVGVEPVSRKHGNISAIIAAALALSALPACKDTEKLRDECLKLRSGIVTLRKDAKTSVEEIKILNQLQEDKKKKQRIFERANRKTIENELRVVAQQFRLRDAKIMVGKAPETTPTRVERIKFRVDAFATERSGTNFINELAGRADRWYIIDRYRQKINPTKGIKHTIEGWFYSRVEILTPPPLPVGDDLQLDWPLPQCGMEDIEQPLKILREGYKKINGFVTKAKIQVPAREQFNLSRDNAFNAVQKLVDFRRKFIHRHLTELNRNHLLLVDLKFINAGAEMLVAGMGRSRDRWRRRLSKYYDFTAKKSMGDAQNYLVYIK